MFSEFRNIILKTLAISAVGVGLYYLIPKVPELVEKVTEEEDTREEIIAEQKVEKKYKRKMKIARSPSSLLNDIMEREEEEPREEIADVNPPSVTSVIPSSPRSFDSGTKKSAERARSSDGGSSSSSTSNNSNTLNNLSTDVATKEGDPSTTDKILENDKDVVECSINCQSENTESSEETVATSGGSTDSGESSSTSSTNTTKPTITVDIGSGNFSTNPSVILTSDIGGDIYYCLNAGACCDPSSSGTLYSGTFPIGAADGNYCLTYYGVSTSGVSGDQTNQAYLVDSTLPNLTSTVVTQYIQTTTKAAINITSTEFGNAGFDYGLYNLATDPAALTCAQIEATYSHATNGVDFDGDTFVDFYDLGVEAGPLATNLEAPIMNYGAIGNFFVSILGNRNLATDKLSCATHKVVLMDFDYFNHNGSSGTVPVNGGGHMEMSGSFGSYGIFRAPAAVNDFSIKSGTSRHEEDINNVLESSAAEIMN